jgi:thiamine biosynthesis lipoprotein
MHFCPKFAACILLLGLLSGCGAGKEASFSGATMGTTYHIKVVCGYFTRTHALKAKIDSRLQTINQSMSIYLPASEISRFNALQSTDERRQISDDFFRVLQVGKLLYDLTKGAWDATVGPLVSLWGFGSTAKSRTVPDKKDIQRRLSETGFDRLELSETGQLRKKETPVSLDLGSIAKGYAVDQVAELLRAEGMDNFLVEIGGEVFAAGYRKDKEPWRIGINQPLKGARLDALYGIARLHDRAMATSGDYRNYFEADGKTYSHILDPRTGYPVANGVVSVTVTAPTCTFADGLATAVMVMGREKGLALVEQLREVEALVIVRSSEGTLEAYPSKGFEMQPASAAAPSS